MNGANAVEINSKDNEDGSFTYNNYSDNKIELGSRSTDGERRGRNYYCKSKNGEKRTTS